MPEYRRQCRRVLGIKGHVDGWRHLVPVLDLGLGQGGRAVETPVHRLHALVQVPVVDDAGQRAQHVCLVAGIQGAVGMIPVAQHTKPLEVFPLQVDLAQGVFPALPAERGRVHLVAHLADLFFHLVFDGQTVAIPARHVG